MVKNINIAFQAEITSSKMVKNIPTLPQEMLLEIFQHLPTKAVGKFRCMSKKWNTQLSTKQFIDSHLTRNKTRQEKEKRKQLALVIPASSFQIVNLPLENERMGNVSQEIENNSGLGLNAVRLSKLVGSCNGLVLLLKRRFKYSCHIFVVNPITRQEVIIPNPDSFDIKDPHCGFGYDPSSDDYKVFSVSKFGGSQKSSFVDLYSLKKKTWERVCEFPFSPSANTMPFVSGAIHWLSKDDTCDSKYRIDAFDLATKTFHQVPFPKEVNPQKVCRSLVVVKNCLAVVFTLKNIVHVWVMKEYGVVDSWVMLSFDISMIKEEMKPVCPIGCGKHLYVTTDGMDCLISCSEWRFSIDWGSIGYASWSIFVESLVSPEQEDVVAHEV